MTPAITLGSVGGDPTNNLPAPGYNQLAERSAPGSRAGAGQLDEPRRDGYLTVA
jgi:hypothetical protein